MFKNKIMGHCEYDKCDFCQQIKDVGRTYLKPSKYIKPELLEERNDLYNQGDYFIIIKTCSDCGTPKLINSEKEEKNKDWINFPHKQSEIEFPE